MRKYECKIYLIIIINYKQIERLHQMAATLLLGQIEGGDLIWVNGDRNFHGYFDLHRVVGFCDDRTEDIGSKL
jgi:hypothetical protein